jgi:TRL-like protein family
MSTSKKLIAFGLAASGLLSLSGCAGVYSPAAGSIWTDTKFGSTATTAAAASKTGKACATSYLGMVALGDASVAAAKAAGGITTVSSVDHTANWMLVFGTFCTVVKGS